MTYVPNPDDDSGFDEPPRPFLSDLVDAIVGAVVAAALALAIVVAIMAIRGHVALGVESATQWVDLNSRSPPASANTAGHVCRLAHTVTGGRPSQCPIRAWCECWLASCLGLEGRELWHARSWLKVGRLAPKPAPGAIAVYARGGQRGHVGIITRVLGPGRIVLLSGNDGGSVRERERSTRGVIAYRWP